MVAYEVFLNDKRLCLAGIDGDGVLNAILSYGRGGQVDHLHITVGGLIRRYQRTASVDLSPPENRR